MALLPNVDSDVVAVPKHMATDAPMLGDVIDEKTGRVVDKMPVEPEWESTWMKYSPISELTQMTSKKFKVRASQDPSKKTAGELVKWPQRTTYSETVERFSDIVCKTLDIAAFMSQYENNHVLNTSRRVVVAVYAVRRVEGGYRVIAYLPALLCFRSKHLAQVRQSHLFANLDLRTHTDLSWMHAEMMQVDDDVARAVTKKRFSTFYIYSLPRHELDHLQRTAGCALEIFSWA